MKNYILALFVLSLPPLLWWFPVGSIVDATDIIFPLNPSLSLFRDFFAWDPINLTGSYQTAVQLNLSKFPIYLYLSISDFFNLPLWVINRFWYWAYLFFPALAYFLFISELFYRKQNKYWIGLISAAFYIYNLYYVQQVIDQAITLSLIFAPLFIFFILRGIRTGKVLFYSILIGIFNFFYSPINPNSYLVGVLLIIFFVFTLSTIFIYQKKWHGISRLLQITLLGSFFGLLSASYVFLPTFYYLQETTGTIQSESADWLQGVSRYTSFNNVSRLLGAWDWYEGHNGEFYMPFAQIFHKNIFFILLAYIPPVLALAALVLSKDKWKYFFAFLALAGIFLAMGSHPPTGQGYVFLYNHLPLFWIFRSPWYKFGFFIIFAYSGLIGLLAEKLFKKYSPKKVAFILLTIFIILAHPLFLGTRFTKPEDRHGNLAAIANFMPAYVFKTADWLNSQPGTERVVMVPQITWESTAYTWEYGNLVPPLYTLLEKNSVLYLPYSREGAGIELLKAAKVSLYNPDSTPSANYLGFLNAKYLINQKDFSYWHFRGPENAEIVEGFINKQAGYKKINTFGPWDVYETDKFLPKIYAASKVYQLDNLYESGNLNLDEKPAFVLAKDSVEELPVLGKENLTNISFEYINPTFYKVNLESEGPIVLVFSEAFNKNWKLRSTDKQIEYDHFLINSYANGYYVKDSGDMDLEIKFLPQENFDSGWKITFTSLGILIASIVVLLVKEKMLKSPKENRKKWQRLSIFWEFT